jgi:hypothetical protein
MNWKNVASFTLLALGHSPGQLLRRAQRHRAAHLRFGRQEDPARRLDDRRPQGADLEAGFANLKKSETTVLVHFGTVRTQQWALVRIEPPAARTRD